MKLFTVGAMLLFLTVYNLPCFAKGGSVEQKLHTKKLELEKCTQKLDILRSRKAAFLSTFPKEDLRPQEIKQEIETLDYTAKLLKKRAKHLKNRLLKYQQQYPSQDLNWENSDHQNHLQVALRNNKFEEASYWIKQGIDLKHKDKNGYTALMYAIQQQRYDLISEMISASPDLNHGPSVFDIPMSLDMLKFLTEQGVSPRGKSGLVKFIQNEGIIHLENLKHLLPLLELGFDPNKDYALHFLAATKPTVSNEQITHIEDALELLLRYGANPLLKNDSGNTPLQVAKKEYQSVYSLMHGNKDQISQRIINFFSKAEKWYSDKTCSICLENLSTTKETDLGPCGNHGFHQKCLTPWLAIKKECPTCRTRMP